MVKLFVGNLNLGTKPSDLRKKFEPYGKVTECDVVNNYGFVHFENDDAAETAIKDLQNTLLDGAKINVEISHSKRNGPSARRKERRRPPRSERLSDPYPSRRLSSGPPPMPPPPKMGRYGPSWDDRHNGYYGPPRDSPRGYDYPPPPANGRYPPDHEVSRPHAPPPPRYQGREPLPPPPSYSYRGPVEPVPSSGREYYKSSPAPRPPYDSYSEYDRYRDHPPPSSHRPGDYYDNYGSYTSGEYRDGDRYGSYDNGYDYGYYDYASDSRSPMPRSGYSYGRP